MVEQLDFTSLVETVTDDSHNVLDDFLIYGGNHDTGKLEIIDAFQKGIAIDDIARLMSKRFQGGNGIENRTAWYDFDGITVTDAVSKHHFTWREAAERVQELLNAGNYATIAELDAANRTVRDNAAKDLWYMMRDVDHAQIPEFHLDYFAHGFENDIVLINIHFVERLDLLYKDLNNLIDAYTSDKNVMRFHFYKPLNSKKLVAYAVRPKVKTYYSKLNALPKKDMFITDKEIETAITKSGSSVCGWRDRYALYFKEHTEAKDRIQFLKNEYGIGGRSHALSGATGSSENHDAKGILFRKRNCKDVMLPWNKVLPYYEKMYRSECND